MVGLFQPFGLPSFRNRTASSRQRDEPARMAKPDWPRAFVRGAEFIGQTEPEQNENLLVSERGWMPTRTSSRAAAAGEMFLLTSPFVEHPIIIMFGSFLRALVVGTTKCTQVEGADAFMKSLV
jgi:hypothetical protein